MRPFFHQLTGSSATLAQSGASRCALLSFEYAQLRCRMAWQLNLVQRGAFLRRGTDSLETIPYETRKWCSRAGCLQRAADAAKLAATWEQALAARKTNFSRPTPCFRI